MAILGCRLPGGAIFDDMDGEIDQFLGGIIGYSLDIVHLTVEGYYELYFDDRGSFSFYEPLVLGF